ncbi:MAG: dihydroflavonol-4-reductase [Myxococcota bacterium]
MRPLPRHALVTGGAGFVGHGVVCALRRAGAAVTVLDPAPAHPLWPQGVRHLRGDLRQPEVLRRAAEGCDLIFHVAGSWDGRPGGDARMRTLNVGGTEAVLGLGLPVVYTSSSITCGFGSRDRPGREDEPSEAPRTAIAGTGRVYRETKLAAEQRVCAVGGWLVNPDYVIGAGDVAGVVTRPLLRAARLPLICAPRGGKSFVSVADTGEAHLLAWRHGAPGRRYLIGSENLSYAEIFQRIAAAAGRRPLIVGLPRTVAPILRRLPRLRPLGAALEQMGLQRYRSSTRARSELRWQPAPLDQAIEEMLRFAQP